MKKLTLAALIAVLTACSRTSAQQPRQPAPNETVATVGGAAITLAEVDDKALEQPASNFGSAKLSQALYEARRAALDEIVANRLMDAAAKAQGIERAALIEKEITAKVAPVSDTDIAAWYQANQGRLQGAPLDQVRQPIRAYLTQERMQDVRGTYVDSLKAKTDRPRDARSAAAEGRDRRPARQGSGERADRDGRVLRLPVPVLPARRSDGAAGAAAPTATRSTSSTATTRCRTIRRRGRPPKRRRAPTSRASSGRITTVLFANPSKLSDADLKQHARRLSASNTRAVQQPASTRTSYKPVVEADVKAGEEAGVNGTPAFFINGRMISGAQPFDAFKQIIDDELAARK